MDYPPYQNQTQNSNTQDMNTQYYYQNNNTDDYQVVYQDSYPALSTVPPKKTNGKLIGTIVGGVVAFVAIVVTILIVALSHPGSTDNKVTATTKTTKPVRTEYAVYLKDKILQDNQLLDPKKPETKNKGVYSALISDMDEDKNEEMVVAFAEEEGDSIAFKIACYLFDDQQQAVKASDVLTVKEKENYDPYDGHDPMDSFDNYFTFPYEEMMYSVKHNGKTYIVYEWLNYWEGYDYEAHVYTLQDDKLTEVGNLFVPNISSIGEDIVYSEKLPEDMKVDNSDFDFSFEGGDYIKDSFGDDTILYYITPEYYGGYEYNSYYPSIDAASIAFFHCFGIEKNGDVAYDSEGVSARYFLLEEPAGVNMIFSNVHYVVSDYTTNENREVYEFNDYSDLQPLLESVEGPTTTTATTTTQVQAKATALTAGEEDFTMLEDFLDNNFTFTIFWSEPGESETVDFSTYNEADLIYQFFIPPVTYEHFFGEVGMSDSDYADPKDIFELDGLRLDADKADWMIENMFNVPVNRNVVGKLTQDEGVITTHYYDGNSLYVLPWEAGWIMDEIYVVDGYQQMADGSYKIDMTMYEYEPDEEDVVLAYIYDIVLYATLKEDPEYGRYWSFQKYTYTMEED